MTQPINADIAVLGGGSGGYAAAIRAAQLGKSVALVEAAQLGGTCLHRGCVPTKALLRAAEVADTVRSASAYGIAARLKAIDMPAVHAFKDSIITRLHSGLQALIASHRIQIVTGHGILTGPNTIAVNDQQIHADHLVIATGSQPKDISTIPFGARVITSDQALISHDIPSRVAVLGGGVIGVEFASLYASLGAEVTIIEALPQLLPNEDTDAVRYLGRALRRRKVAAKTATTVTDIVETDQRATVTLNTGQTLDVDIVLVAVGRQPRTADIGLEVAGVVAENGYIKTDRRLRTSQPTVYAVGDVVAGVQLAHRGFAQGIFVAEHIAGCQPAEIDELGIPRVIYSHPEVASVGLTERAARDLFGDEIQVSTYDLAGNAKSHILKTAGMVKTVVGPDNTVVGVHMVGDRIGELIGEAQQLYNLGADASTAAQFIHAHPSQSEALGEALLAVAGAPLHTHG